MSLQRENTTVTNEDIATLRRKRQTNVRIELTRCSFSPDFQFSELANFNSFHLIMKRCRVGVMSRVLPVVLGSGKMLSLVANKCDIDNELLTKIPKSMWEASANCLRTLDLSGNNLTHLPKCVGSLRGLKELHVSENRQMRTFPSDNDIALPNLTTFVGGKCSFEHIPTFLVESPQLEYFYAYENRNMSNRLDDGDDVFFWPDLIFFRVPICSFWFAPNFLKRSSKLARLSFAENVSIDELPAWFTELSSLRVVDYSKTDVSVIPDEWRHMPSLSSLSLNESQVRAVPDFVVRWPQLHKLELENCPIEMLSSTLLLDTRIKLDNDQARRLVVRLWRQNGQYTNTSLRDGVRHIQRQSPRDLSLREAYIEYVAPQIERQNQWRETIVRMYTNGLVVWRTTGANKLKSLDVGGTMPEVMKRTI